MDPGPFRAWPRHLWRQPGAAGGAFVRAGPVRSEGQLGDNGLKLDRHRDRHDDWAARLIVPGQRSEPFLLLVDTHRSSLTFDPHFCNSLLEWNLTVMIIILVCISEEIHD